MIVAANKAARSLRRDFREVEHLQVARKGPGDFVTMADLKAQKIIQEERATARPGYGFLMEEKGKIEGGDKTHVWIIDPLDGTTNFLHGIPHFAISIALMREAQLVAAIVYQPITDELFYAEKGQGAFLSAATIPKMRLQVAKRTKLQDAVFACGIPHGVRGGLLRSGQLQQPTHQVGGVRPGGAAAVVAPKRAADGPGSDEFLEFRHCLAPKRGGASRRPSPHGFRHPRFPGTRA